MRTLSVLCASLFCGLSLSACGTYVPDIADYPDNIDDAHKLAFVSDIVYSVRCELQKAIVNTIDNELSQRTAPNFYSTAFLKNWGVQVALMLKVDEKTVVSPNAVLTPPSPITSVFTLPISGSATTAAVRVNKVNYFYKVSELYKMGKVSLCKNIDQQTTSSGSRLIRSDLKLTEWLNAFAAETASRQFAEAPKQNVLSQQVTFEVIKTGSISPAWKLTRATINQGANLLSGTRDRTHDLTLTFGPIDGTSNGTSLIPVAEQAHLTSQFAAALRGSSTIGQ